MKNKTYILNIQNPCHEKWDRMQPENGGKFCMQCSKKVFDFTELDNAEIIQIIGQSKGRICGRMSKSQLNQPIEIQPKKKNKSKLYKVLAGVFLIGTTGNVFATKPPLAESEVLPAIDNNFQPRKMSFVQSEIDSLKNIIQGQVFTEFEEEPIPEVHIFIKELNLEIKTDLEGNFLITLPEDFSADYITIFVTYPYFQDYETRIYKNELPLVKKFYLKEEVLILGQIITRKIRWWQFWKRL